MQQDLYKYPMHLLVRYFFCYPRDHYFCSDEFHKIIQKTVVMEVFFYEKILSIQNHSQAKTTQQKQK